MRRVSSVKMRETNPKCEIITDLRVDGADPTADITFSKCAEFLLSNIII